jgi:hypothetical protein
MKQISVKGLADFMTASASRQRKIIHEYKYPTEDEARAKILYYREARDRIEICHRAGYPTNWLLSEAYHIDALASSSMGRTKTRLSHNSRALRSYSKHFTTRAFKVLDDLSLSLIYGDVRVTAVPDLHVEEKGQERVLKFDFSVDPPLADEVKIICQVLFEALGHAALTIPASSVLFLDVERGRVHKGARVGARMRRDVEATCQTISAIWDKI